MARHGRIRNDVRPKEAAAVFRSVSGRRTRAAEESVSARSSKLEFSHSLGRKCPGLTRGSPFAMSDICAKRSFRGARADGRFLRLPDAQEPQHDRQLTLLRWAPDWRCCSFSPAKGPSPGCVGCPTSQGRADDPGCSTSLVAPVRSGQALRGGIQARSFGRERTKAHRSLRLEATCRGASLSGTRADLFVFPGEGGASSGCRWSPKAREP